MRNPSRSLEPCGVRERRGPLEGQGIQNFTGPSAETSSCSSALTGKQATDHWMAGGHAAAAPTGVTASALQSAAHVSWTAPTSTGDSPIAGYVVSAINGGVVIATTATSSPLPTATISPLSAALSYTFTVAAKNSTYTGQASSASSAITPLGPTAGNGFNDLYYYSDDNNSGNQPNGRYGLVTQANIPAMSTWTIEGWIGGQSSLGNTSSGASWGMLNGSVSNPSAGSNVAGSHFSLGSAPLETVFVWPVGN